MKNIIFFLKQILEDKTIYRILFNFEVRKNCSSISGNILDLASGPYPSYRKYLPNNIEYKKSDYEKKDGLDFVVDLNNDLDFHDRSFDNILLFNAVYIIKDREKLFKEINRILKDNGVLFIASPFIANEMKQPDDFCRLTAQGLEFELNKAGFNNIKIKRFGERFTSSIYLINPIMKTPILKIIFYPIALLLDYLIPKKTIQNYPCPLGYFCIIKK